MNNLSGASTLSYTSQIEQGLKQLLEQVVRGWLEWLDSDGDGEAGGDEGGAEGDRVAAGGLRGHPVADWDNQEHLQHVRGEGAVEEAEGAVRGV